MFICPASFFSNQRTKNSLFNNSKNFNFVIDYVQRSFTRNVQQIRESLEIHMIIMIICPASFFRCQRTKNSLFKNSKIFNFVIDYVQRSFTRNVIYSKRTALTANSTTPSDSPDSRDSYDHNDYMPSLIF
ncbi:hypothetical protein Avbf_07705 [Armadillidium vulgare]|nr:hypothetical protein Avbf_07705 [Armadillidium vulgare]